jgi:hypothetical protein
VDTNSFTQRASDIQVANRKYGVSIRKCDEVTWKTRALENIGVFFLLNRAATVAPHTSYRAVLTMTGAGKNIAVILTFRKRNNTD